MQYILHEIRKGGMGKGSGSSLPIKTSLAQTTQQALIFYIMLCYILYYINSINNYINAET